MKGAQANSTVEKQQVIQLLEASREASPFHSAIQSLDLNHTGVNCIAQLLDVPMIGRHSVKYNT